MDVSLSFLPMSWRQRPGRLQRDGFLLRRAIEGPEEDGQHASGMENHRKMVV